MGGRRGPRSGPPTPPGRRRSPPPGAGSGGLGGRILIRRARPGAQRPEVPMSRRKVVLMGAAGRDFHNFNTLFRYDGRYEVVAFTAAQIPDIEGRLFPPELAGPFYPQGIPIRAEEELERIIRDQAVDEVWFSYSDVSYSDLM